MSCGAPETNELVAPIPKPTGIEGKSAPGTSPFTQSVVVLSEMIGHSIERSGNNGTEDRVEMRKSRTYMSSVRPAMNCTCGSPREEVPRI